MAGRTVGVKIKLDFLTGDNSIEDIKQQIDKALTEIKLDVSLDEKDIKRAEHQLKELGKLVEKSYNPNMGKVDLKQLSARIANSELPGLDLMEERFQRVGLTGEKAINDIRDSSKHMNLELKESDTVLSRMGETLANTIRWNISSKVVNSFTGALRDTYYYAKDLERELNDIRIVSGQTAEQMGIFAIEANKAAKVLGSSTKDYVQASKIFYQQGLDDQAVRDMSDAAIIGANITGEAAADIADLLTSTMNGYRMASGEVMDVMDKISAVGASSASDFEELATGMSKVASMANSAGVPIDNLIAQLATITSVTREAPESIGTSLKTIYGRMVAFKANTDKMMEDDDGELFGAPQVEKALERFGQATKKQISLFEQTEDGSRVLRDLSDVIEDIGDAWGDTTDKSVKFGLATAVAGTRQQNRLISLFDSWDDYQGNLMNALDSEGTAWEQNEIYLDSYDGKLKQLQATKETLYAELTDSESMKSFIDAMIVGVELATELTNAIGGVWGILGMVGSLLSSQIAGGLMAATRGVQDLVATASSAKETVDRLKAEEDLSAMAMVKGEAGAKEMYREYEALKEVVQKRKEKRDLLQEEQVMIQNIARAYGDLGASEAAEDRVSTTIKHNDKLDLTKERLEEIRTSYQLLAVQTEQLATAELELSKDPGNEALQAAVQKMKEDLELYRNAVRDLNTDLNSQIKESFGGVKGAEEGLDPFEKTMEQGRKLKELEVGVTTFLRVVPGLLSVVSDEASSTGDILKVIGVGILTSAPRIISHLSRSKDVMAATGIAAKIAAGGMSLLTSPISLITIGLGIGAIAWKKYKDKVNETQDTLDEFVGLNEELAEEESKVEGLILKVDELKEKYKELGAEKERSQAEELEYAGLKSEIADTELELRIQERITEEKRKQRDFEVEGMFDKSDGSGELDQIQRLRNLNETYERYGEYTTKAKKSLDELLVSEDASAKQIEEARDLVEQRTGIELDAMEDLADAYTKLYQARAEAEEIDGIPQESLDQVDRWLGITADALDITHDASWIIGEMATEFGELGVGAAAAAVGTAEFGIKAEEMRANIADAEEAVSYLEQAMGELDNQGGISADVLNWLIELYPELTNVADLQDDQLRILLQTHLDKANNAIKSEIAETNATKRAVGVRMSHYKAEIAALQALISARSAAFEAEYSSRINRRDAKLGIDMMAGADPGMLNMMDSVDPALAALERQKRDYQQAVRNAEGELRGLDSLIGSLEGSLAGMADGGYVSDSSGGKGSGGGGGDKSKGSGGKGAGAGSKAAADARRAEADAYQKVNLEIDRLNSLLERNATLQELAEGDTEERVKLMREEIDLHKRHQVELNNLNQLKRLQVSRLESQLSGQGFLFSGKGDERMITNLGHIEGKTEDVKKAFDEYITLQRTDIPKASNEWWKLKSEISKVEKAITEVYKEELSERRSNSEFWIRQRQHFDDWGADHEIAAWERVRDYVQDYYDKGLIDHKTYIENVMSVNDSLESAQKDLSDKMKDLIQAEYDYHKLAADKRFAEKSELLDEEEAEMDRRIEKIEGKIEDTQNEIDAIQESERLREEQKTRKKYLTDISNLQQKNHYLEFVGLGNITEEQAKLVGLEQERAQYIDMQNSFKEKQLQIDNLREQRTIQELKKQSDGTWAFEYASDKRAIDKLDKEIKKDRAKHSEDMKKLAEKTNEDLEKIQEDFDEWERQNQIRVTIEAKQTSIKAYQDEIKTMQDAMSDKREAAKLEHDNDLDNLKAYYRDMDKLVKDSLETLGGIYGTEWGKIEGALTKHFDTIKEEHEKLRKEMETPIVIPPPITSSSGSGQSPGSGSAPGYGAHGDGSRPTTNPNPGAKGAATGQAATDNVSKLKSDAGFREAERRRAQSVIDGLKSQNKDTSLQESYLDSIDRYEKGSYKHGGKIDSTGTMLADMHGTKNAPEWIFNDEQLRKVIGRSVVKSVDELMVKAPVRTRVEQKTSKQEQVFNISSLEFPNVTSSEEIQSALRELPNKAIQRVK